MDIKNRLTNNGQPFKIQHKFREECLIPDVAIDVAHRTFKFLPKDDMQSWRKAEFITSDGVLVNLDFISGWIGDCDEVEGKIKQMYKHSIAKHKGFYYINDNNSAWHHIKMIKI